MTNTVADIQSLPEILFRLIQTDKVLVQESGNGVISLTPLREGSGLRGIAKKSKLTTEKLLAYNLEEKEHEN